MASNKHSSSDGYENSFLSLKRLYLNMETADVFFKFADGETVPAHKSILIAECDVFKAMFYGELKEEGDINIIDASADEFKTFLQFFYLDKIHLSMETISAVVNLGKKYDVVACLKICETFLKDSLTIEYACFCYGLAILYDLKELKHSCEVVISENTNNVFQSTGFLECDRSVLAEILKLNAMSCFETKVFEACMAWVKAKQDGKLTKEVIETHLGDMFYEIRFGSMAIKEFTDLLPSYGNIFMPDEYQEIIQSIINQDSCSKMFKKDPRHIQWNSDKVIKCRLVDATAASPVPLEHIESIILSTNKSILLGEIMYPMIVDESECDTYMQQLSSEVTIIEKSNDEIPKIISHMKIVLEKATTFDTSGNISLLRPVLMKPSFTYEIQFRQIPTNIIFLAKSPKREEKIADTDIIITIANTYSRSFISELGLNQIHGVDVTNNDENIVEPAIASQN